MKKNKTKYSAKKNTMNDNMKKSKTDNEENTENNKTNKTNNNKNTTKKKSNAKYTKDDNKGECY